MDYRYTETGLENVIIKGMDVPHDDAGEEVYSIKNILGLHKVIAHCIVTRPGGMSPNELRFVRTEMGLTQAELAELVKRDRQAIGRWERGEVEIDETAEFAIRMLAMEKLELDRNLSTEEMLRRCVPSAEPGSIIIDGSDPDNYRIWKEAA